MTNFEWPPANAQAAVRSNAKKRRRPENRWRIEGEYVTCAEIGERIGIGESAAASRLRRLQRASGPITWDRLRAA